MMLRFFSSLLVFQSLYFLSESVPTRVSQLDACEALFQRITHGKSTSQEFSVKIFTVLPMFNTVQIDEQKCNEMVRFRYKKVGIEDYADIAFKCSPQSRTHCTPVIVIEHLEVQTGNKQPGLSGRLTTMLEQYLRSISSDPATSIQLFAMGDNFDEKYVDDTDEPSGDVLGSYVWAKAGFQWLNPKDNGLFQERFFKHLHANGWSEPELRQLQPVVLGWKSPLDFAKYTGNGIAQKAGKPWGRNFLLLRSWHGVIYPNQVRRQSSIGH